MCTYFVFSWNHLFNLAHSRLPARVPLFEYGSNYYNAHMQKVCDLSSQSPDEMKKMDDLWNSFYNGRMRHFLKRVKADRPRENIAGVIVNYKFILNYINAWSEWFHAFYCSYPSSRSLIPSLWHHCNWYKLYLLPLTKHYI